MGDNDKDVPKMLVSFIHGVAVMVDGRVFSTHAVICEEIFGAKTTLEESQGQEGAKEAIKKRFFRSWREKPPLRATLDFPLYIKVTSLGDGKPLPVQHKMLVKYSNISAIMEL